MMSKASTNRQIMDAAWDEVFDLKARIAANEAERAKPYPVITPCLLIAFALAMFAVNLAVFGKGAW